MRPNCQRFCPIAPQCRELFEQNSAQRQEALQEEAFTRMELSQLEDETALTENRITYEKIVQDLLKDGFLHPTADHEQVVSSYDRLLDFSEQQRSNSADLRALKIKLEQKNAARKRLDSYMFMARRAIAELTTEQQQCDGPVLSWKGRFRWVRAVAYNHLFPNNLPSRDAYKPNLAAARLVRCSSRSAQLLYERMRDTPS